jgi:hypothetical protein
MLSFKQFLLEGYVAFVLSPASKSQLLEKFPPKFSDVYADHITYQFGVPRPEHMPSVDDVQVIGYACGEGIEAAVVAINGNTKRLDGSTYHITLSLDYYKGVRPKDSNVLLKQGWDTVPPFDVHVRSEFIK